MLKDPIDVFCSFCSSKAGDPCTSNSSGKLTPTHNKRRESFFAAQSREKKLAGKAVAAQPDPTPQTTAAQRCFGDDLLVEVNDVLTIVRADKYDRENGYEYRLMTTHNGYQFSGTNAIDKRTAAKLRDALDALLKGREGWL